MSRRRRKKNPLPVLFYVLLIGSGVIVAGFGLKKLSPKQPDAPP